MSKNANMNTDSKTTSPSGSQSSGFKIEKMKSESNRRRAKKDMLKKRFDAAKNFDHVLWQSDFNAAQTNEERDYLTNMIAHHHATWADIYNAQRQHITSLRDEISNLKDDISYAVSQNDTFITRIVEAEEKIENAAADNNAIETKLCLANADIDKMQKLVNVSHTCMILIGCTAPVISYLVQAYFS